MQCPDCLKLRHEGPCKADLDEVWNLIDMARGLIGLGKAHDLLGDAQAELSVEISKK